MNKVHKKIILEGVGIMKKRQRFKRMIALGMATLLIFTSAGFQELSAKAAQVPVDESIQVPFGQVISYNEANETIGVVWGFDGVYTTYTVSITGVDTDYSDVITGQPLGYHEYASVDRSYQPGKTYRVEIQGEGDGVLSLAAVGEVTIPGVVSDVPQDPEESGQEPTVDGSNLLLADHWDFWTEWDGLGALSVNTDGSADVTVNAEGNNNYSVQYTQNLNLTEGTAYRLTGDFYCDQDAVVFVNLQETLGWASILPQSPYQLQIKAGETAHLDLVTNTATANFVQNGKLALMFGQGTGNAGKTIRVSNMNLSVYDGSGEAEIGEEPEAPDEKDGIVANGVIDLEKSNTELYVGSDWAGTSGSLSETASKAVISAGSYGWNGEWGMQYIVKDLGLSNDTSYTVSFDITSSIDKYVRVKLDDNGFIYDLLALKAGETYHYSKTVECGSFANNNLYFALGADMSLEAANLAGSLVIENVKIAKVREAVDLEKADTEFYVGSDWAGTAASLTENATKATIDVASFGWNGEWGLQYIIKDLGLSDDTVYTVEFDITSTVDKNVFVKLDDASGFIAETLSLSAGETYHYVKEVECGAFSAKPYLYFALGQMSGEEANRAGVITIDNLIVYSESEDSEVVDTNAGAEYDFSADNSAYDYADPGLSKDGYTLIWADEFDGNYGADRVDAGTGLNLSNWAYQLGDGSTDCGNYGWGNNELQAYTGNQKNIAVNEDLNGDGTSDGLLRITASYEPGYVYAGEGAKNYTSARIRTTSSTEALFNTTYGYIEARMSLPATQGAWPAFWMLPQSTNIYGGWPVSGEIDIMETCGGFSSLDNNVACGTLHWGVPSHVYKGSGYVTLDSAYTYFHTYAVDWQPGQITWYYDGKAINTLSNWESAFSGASDSLSFDAPFDMPFYILLNLAVDSGQFGGSANKAMFQDDINMYVDYVRVFQKTEGYPGSVVRSASEGAANDWADYAGINQIAQITEDALVGQGGGLDDRNSDLTKWYLSNQNDATDATLTNFVDTQGKTWAKVGINSPGGQDYSVQLIGHYNAKKGYVYKISYDAYADGAIVGKSVNCDSKEWMGWSTYGIQSFKLTDTPATYSYTVEQTEDFDNCRIEFNLGAAASGNVYISNVKVEIVDPATIGQTTGSRSALANGNMIYNGSFDQGNYHLGYWTADEGTTVVVPRYTTEKIKDGDVSVVDIASKTNYEQIADGLKYYERRAQISAAAGIAPRVYQSGFAMTADTYTVNFDLYSIADTAVKVSAYTLEEQDGKEVLGRELASATASYSAANGLKSYTLVFSTREDAEQAALVFTFAKGSEVQIDNVYMNGANQKSSVEEHPLNTEATWRGDNGEGGEIGLDISDGVVTMRNITSGGTWYSPQLASNDFSLVAGQKYTLSFLYKMTGSSNKTFQYIIQENGGSWYVYNNGPTTVTYEESAADADGYCTYSVTFTADNTLTNVHLNFGFGNSQAVGDLAFSFKDAKIDLVKVTAGGDGTGADDSETVDDSLFENDDQSQEPGVGEGGSDQPDQPGIGEGGNDEPNPTEPEITEPEKPEEPVITEPEKPSTEKPVVIDLKKVVTTVVTKVVSVVKKVVNTVVSALSKIFKLW